MWPGVIPTASTSRHCGHWAGHCGARPACGERKELGAGHGTSLFLPTSPAPAPSLWKQASLPSRGKPFGPTQPCERTKKSSANWV